MPLKTIFFLGGFVVCCIGALVVPLWGVVGNVFYYMVGTGWWTAPIRHLGIRYSYLLAVTTIIGVMINWRKLRFGESLLVKQEKLALVFLGFVWLSTWLGETTLASNYLVADHPTLRLTKIMVFTFLLTHIVTQRSSLNVIFWVLILGTIHLGLRALEIPQKDFVSGRLESVGGTDFRGSNALAGFLAVMVPIIGIMFLKTNWFGKIVCAVCGALACNTIVLTRSRAGLLGLVGGGLFLAWFIPKQHRFKILACLIVAGIGFISLMDTRFINRSKTILEGTETQDRSAQSRLAIWRAGMQMIRENPLGVGAGNFLQNTGRYAPQIKNRDAHNTYIRCAAELGWHGFALLVVLIVNAIIMLKKTRHQLEDLPSKIRLEYQMMSSALAASFAVFLVSGLTGTLLYMEAFWWWLLLPVCLQRCLDNELETKLETEKPEETSSELSQNNPQL